MIWKPHVGSLRCSWGKQKPKQDRNGRNAGTSRDRVKPPKFDGSTSRAVFHHQFRAMDIHNDWTSCEKAMHLLTTLQEQAADILCGVAARADIIGVLEGRYEDHQLVVVFQNQLKARIQLNSKSLQEFAADVQQSAHWTLSDYLRTLSRGRPSMQSLIE
jgi:hypothetical protein